MFFIAWFLRVYLEFLQMEREYSQPPISVNKGIVMHKNFDYFFFFVGLIYFLMLETFFYY